MDSKAALRFIQAELAPLWPGWRPTQPEIQIWQSWLCDYDLQQAKQNLQRYYAARGASQARPNAKDMLTSGKKSAGLCQTQSVIKCIKHDRKPGYVGRRRRIYTVNAAAEQLCRRFEQLYGGTWTIENGKSQMANRKSVRNTPLATGD
ncbi:MAG: hypothetical protein ACE5NM_07360 [Sedimentisphaerales bacterium]